MDDEGNKAVTPDPLVWVPNGEEVMRMDSTGFHYAASHAEGERVMSIYFHHNQPVGWFHFAASNAKFAAYRKPRWLTRFMFRVFFELEWEDYV